MDSNFNDVVDACKKDCFGVHKTKQCPKWFNKMKYMFDVRQAEIESSMKTLSKIERETVLKNMIHIELEKHKIEHTNDRIVLQFVETFSNTSNVGVKTTLCEDCFWGLYNHKCSKRTYEYWKFILKKRIAFDRDAARIQARLKPILCRKQKNW